MKLVFGLGESIFALLSKVSFVAAFASWILSLLAGIVFLVMLPWDVLVWLFNTDWQTTNFRAPLVSLGLSLGFGFAFVLFDKCDAILAAAEEWFAARS